jgi:hypothetical protein
VKSTDIFQIWGHQHEFVCCFWHEFCVISNMMIMVFKSSANPNPLRVLKQTLTQTLIPKKPWSKP